MTPVNAADRTAAQTSAHRETNTLVPGSFPQEIGAGIKLRVISLGAGVQSTTMALMAAHGEIGPMPDCAIFADTQGEPKAVYDHLAWLMSPGVLPFPVHVVTAGSLWLSASKVRRTRDGLRSYVSTGIPVYTSDGISVGIGRRQCTRTFKVDPINRKIRELSGLARVLKKHGTIAEVWIGISADEASRMKPSVKPYLVSRWPLIERDMDRQDCLDWLAEHGYPVAPRSACTFCPFRDDESWRALTPEEFSDVVRKEPDLQAAYAQTEMRSVPYFHESRIPLGAVKLSASIKAPKPRQRNLFINECSGLCGT